LCPIESSFILYFRLDDITSAITTGAPAMKVKLRDAWA
jgi:hypothetical protein